MQYTVNKGFAEDLSEGKFSFPIVHAVRANTSNRQVLSESWLSVATPLRLMFLPLDVLQKRPSTPTTKQYVVNYMRDRTKSFQYTWKVLDTLERQSREEIRRLGGNPKLEVLMDVLAVPAPKMD